MKRILSLIMCVIMVMCMSVTAFAGEWYSEGATFVPGTEITFDHAWLDSQVSDALDNNEHLTTENYRISFDIDHGANYVANVYIDDEDELAVIKLKTDYGMYKEKTIDGELEIKHKESHKSYKIPVSFKMNNIFDETSIDFTTAGDEISLIPRDNTIYEVTDTAPYGTLIFMGVDGSTEVAVRVYEGDHFYLASNENVNKTVVRNNEDIIKVDTDIRFLNFPATPKFDATATVYFYDTDKDYHVYAIDSDNKLTEIGAWDEEEDCIVYKTKSLGSYVICNTKLAVEATTKPVNPSKPNPDTGVDTTGMNIAMAMLGISAIGIAATVGVKKKNNHN